MPLLAPVRPDFSSDRDLLLAYREGDPRALHLIYCRYAPALVSRCRRWQRSRQCPVDIDDLVQEAFYRVFSVRVRDSFDITRPLLPYLLTVTDAVCTDAERSWKRRKRLQSAATACLTMQTAAGPPPDLLAISALRAFLASQDGGLLFNLYRERFVRDRSQRRAARDLGLTHQRVRTLEVALLRSAAKHLSSPANTTRR
jgi:DNA-directed RNA polymerase specialized sigma24 family protein